MKTFKAHIELIRPYQWLKNILLFTPIFFAGQLNADSILHVTGAALCFCLASSLGYIFNDWMDRNRDINHQTKCNRPFCSGRVTGPSGAMLFGALFILLVVCLYYFGLSFKFILILVCYLVLTFAYSLWLKHIAVLEIFIVSLGFVLRVLAGGAAFDIAISDWLFLTILFMSMLITVTKRKVEYDALLKQGFAHRQSLNAYSNNYLYNYLWALGGMTLVVYALYAVEKGGHLVYSVLPAAYGIVRFILISEKGLGGDPIKALFSDAHLMVSTLIFIGFIAASIYVY